MSDDCKKHPTELTYPPNGTVETFDEDIVIDLKELARRIEGLRYDKTVEFLGYLGEAFLKRAREDKKAGKRKLASRLFSVGYSIEDAADTCNVAWKICKPHMKICGCGRNNCHIDHYAFDE